MHLSAHSTFTQYQLLLHPPGIEAACSVDFTTPRYKHALRRRLGYSLLFSLMIRAI